MFQVVQPSAHEHPQEATIKICLSKGQVPFFYLHLSTLCLSRLGITLSKGQHAYVRFSYVTESRRMYIASATATDAGAVKVRSNHRVGNAGIIAKFQLTYGEETKLHMALKPDTDPATRAQWFLIAPKNN